LYKRYIKLYLGDDSVPKTGSNIYKRKDGRWEGRYIKGRKENGRINYGYIYAKTCSELKQKLRIIPSVSKPQIPESAKSITFAGVVKQWLSKVSLKVKPSTYVRYFCILEVHILPFLGEIRVNMIASSDIDCFVKEKLISGRTDGKGGLAGKTVRDMLSIIKNVLNFAYDEKITNIMVNISRLPSRQKAIRVLSRQEQTLLEKVLLEDIDVYKLGILVCLYSGLRIGEICALHWQDISIKDGIISVRQTTQRVKNLDENGGNKTKIITDFPKSQCSLRDIPIPDFILCYISKFNSNKCEYFLSNGKHQRVELRTLQNHFEKYIKEAGIAPANFHSLRHTFATRCIEAGVDIKSLSEMLGHANVNITLNRYVHPSLE
jgi:integrase